MASLEPAPYDATYDIFRALCVLCIVAAHLYFPPGITLGVSSNFAMQGLALQCGALWGLSQKPAMFHIIRWLTLVVVALCLNLAGYIFLVRQLAPVLKHYGIGAEIVIRFASPLHAAR